MPNESTEMIPAQREAPVGFVTQSRTGGLSPALLAEQQRAKSEIEAALTIAAARPRDQKDAMDRILTSCQRPGLAARAKYRYQKGGNEITGVTIDLMEVVAQMWGNLDFGFRELARFPGTAGGPGESIVEAYAWDYETNVKRRVQFTVQHCERTRRGLRIITDPRDIYEWVANQAQRRVRTCLENIIPRDIYEAAADQCEETMKANVGDIKQAVGKLIPAFEKFGVTKEMLEARYQRRIDTLSAAQVVHLRTIWTGLNDGISKPDDWFDLTLGQDEKVQERPKSAAETAKEKMRKQQVAEKEKPSPKPAQEPPAPEPPEPQPPQRPPAVAEAALEMEPTPEPESAPEAATEPVEAPSESVVIPDEVGEVIEEYKFEAEAAETLTGLRELRKHAEGNAMLTANPDALSIVLEGITMREEQIRASRGQRSK